MDMQTLNSNSSSFFANFPNKLDLTNSPVTVLSRLPTPADNKTCKVFVYESAQHGHERIKVGKHYSGKDYKRKEDLWPGTNKKKFPTWWNVQEKSISTLEDIVEHIEANSRKEVGFMRTCPNLKAQMAKGAPGGQGSTKTRTHSEGFTIKHVVKQKNYTLTDEPNQLITIDIDTCPCPDNIDNISKEAAEYVVSQLPEPLSKSSWAYHFSSGAGLQSSKKYIKLHLLGIGTIGVKDSDMKAWAKNFNNKGGIQIDATLYDHVHLLYVRDPEFTGGAVDPFKARGLPRCGIIRGETNKIDTTDIVGFLPPPDKLPVTRSKLVSTKSVTQTHEHIHKDAVALFEENKCHSVVLKTVGRLVNLHYKDTDVDAVFTLITKASQAAISSGKLKIDASTSSRIQSLSRANVEDIIKRSIDNGYGAKPLPIAASVAKKSKYEQFVWALYLNKNQGDALERALTALDIGISSELIGQRFSPDRIIDLILSKHPLSPAKECQLRSRFQYKMDCIKQSIAALTEQPQAGYNVKVIPIQKLEQVKTKPGVVTLVCAPMGLGKTTKVAKAVCQSLNKEVTFITHRVSLTKDAAQVVKMHHYQTKRAPSSEGLVTCINSISNTDHFEFARDKSRAIIIDEIGQVLREVLMSRTMQGNREQIFKAQRELIDDKDKIVIGMDANLCRRDVEIMQAMTDKPIEVFIVADTDPKMNVEILSTAKNARHLPAIMAQDSKAPCVLCADNKHTVKMASGMMEDAGMHGLCVTSETKGNPDNRKALQNINQYVASNAPGFIAFSPTISSGVSITHKHFDHIYGIYSAIVEPADFMQMLKRERTVPDVTVVVDRSKSGTIIDKEAHTKGIEEMTTRPQKEILSDVLYMEQLRSKKLRSVLMLHAGIALDYLFRQKKWNVTYSDVDPLNGIEEALVKNKAKELKEEYIKHIKSAKEVDAITLHAMQSQTHKTEKEEYQIVAQRMRNWSGISKLDRATILFLKNKQRLEKMPLFQSIVDFAPGSEEGVNGALGASVASLKLRVTKHRVINQILKAGGIDYENKQMDVNVDAMLKAMTKARNKLAALGLSDSVRRQMSDYADDKEKIAVIRNFVGKFALTVSTRNKSEHKINLEHFDLMMDYLSSQFGRNYAWHIHSTARMKNLNNREKDLVDAVTKHGFVLLASPWIVDNIPGIKTNRGAEKWIAEMRDFKVAGYRQKEVKIRLKNKGRFTQKIVIIRVKKSYWEITDFTAIFSGKNDIEWKS